MSVAQRIMNIIVFRVHLSLMLLSNVHNTTSNKGGCCMCIGKNKIIDIMIVFFFSSQNIIILSEIVTFPQDLPFSYLLCQI